MKTLLFAIVVLFASSTRPLAAQSEPGGRLLWVVRAGTASEDYAYDVACAQDGSCYVTGEYWGVTNKESEIFLMALTPAGAVSWTRQAGGTYSDRGVSLRVTPAAQLELRGTGFGTLQFPSTGAPTLTKVLDDELYFTATYSLSGTAISVADNLLDEYDLPSRKDAAPHGGVECGWFDFAMPLDPAVLVSAGGRDGRLVEHDATGALSWAVSFGGTGADWATAVALVPNESACIVVGNFHGSATFPDSILDANTTAEVLVSAGNTDTFVAKFTLKDSDGDGTPDMRE